MPVAVLLPLDTWQNFYVIVGTAAATLTGLDVRSHNLDRADTNIVTQELCYGLQHVQRLPFWRRAPGRWDSERTLLECSRLVYRWKKSPRLESHKTNLASPNHYPA